jgi:1-deoxy-D-xylulose-5-phosphate reductoisomerase
MRVPISYALHYPDRPPVASPVNLAEVGELSFEPPDPVTFRCLRLAREAGSAGGNAPCVLNAADEVAVGAFLERRIPFTAIPEVIAGSLERIDPQPFAHFEEVFECDAQARAVAAELVARAGEAVA